MELKGKNVLVCGMARSGVAAGQLLLCCGAKVTVHDLKTEEQLGDALAPLHETGCVFALGEDPLKVVEGRDLIVISPGIAWAKPFVQKALSLGIEVIAELEEIYSKREKNNPDIIVGR